MARTRDQNPLGVQSPLQSLTNARIARNHQPETPRPAVSAPGLQVFYNENVGLFDDDVSELDLDGSVPAPSGASAALRSPSVASDGVVYIRGRSEGDDESETSEPAVDIRLSDDEEEGERAVITISDDEEEDGISIIDISSHKESEDDDEDDISELNLGGDSDENEDEEQEEEIEEPQVHRLYGKVRIKQSILDRHMGEDANRPPFSPNLSLSTERSPSPDRTISPSPKRTISPSPDRTISAPPSPLNFLAEDHTIADPDGTISIPPSPRLANENQNQDIEMSDDDDDDIDDGIVPYQGPPAILYNNPTPSHFTRTYRGTTTIWSVADWEEEGDEILAGEAAERERERLQRRRWARNGGRSRLARQRAWRRRFQGGGERARVNGRFA
ncbi:hypothetical protein BKA65DRAFT_481083 [Rhexocercosporidium sp. MPI-PUGE-AT-0058]|nr:hypothetical protein BKA65DRAFT_481083 [Rhexocercosporidium sp. MPI-PUGE-AT-0058]